MDLQSWFINYNRKDATTFDYLFLKDSTSFGRFLRPSSGAHNCTFSFRYCQPILLHAGIFNWFITQTVYTKCTKLSYKIVPATNFTTQVVINKWKRIVWLRIEVEITAVKSDRKNTAATDRLNEAVHGSYVCMGCVRQSTHSGIVA